MNQNYPEWILQKLEEATEDNPYEDPKTLTPVEALDRLLFYEGIIGYTHTILNWIEGIFKIRLDDSDWDDIKKSDFIQGFGYFMACNNKRAGVESMTMDDREQVTITYEGGGTHTANVYADSFSAAIRDIMKNID